MGEKKISAEDRLALCKIACKDSDWLDVCEWDVRFAGYSSTGAVVREMQTIFSAKTKNVTCVWVCGADHVLRTQIFKKKYVAFRRDEGGEAKGVRRSSGLNVIAVGRRMKDEGSEGGEG